MFSSEKSQLLLEGGNREFYKLKNTVKNHVTLAGGQLHFEALQVRLCSVQQMAIEIILLKSDNSHMLADYLLSM